MVRSQPFQGCNAGSNPVEDTKNINKNKRIQKMDKEYTKWYFIIVIVGIVVLGVYKIADSYFDHMEHMQEVSRQVIEK